MTTLEFCQKAWSAAELEARELRLEVERLVKERDEARQWARYWKAILVEGEEEEERPKGMPKWLEIKGYDSGCGD